MMNAMEFFLRNTKANGQQCPHKNGNTSPSQQISECNRQVGPFQSSSTVSPWAPTGETCKSSCTSSSYSLPRYLDSLNIKSSNRCHSSLLSSLSSSKPTSIDHIEKEETSATRTIRQSAWFVRGRGRSYHDDDFFLKMARVALVIMPSLLKGNGDHYYDNADNKEDTGKQADGDGSNPLNLPSSPPSFSPIKYGREFEFFICNILRRTGLSSIVLLLALKYIHKLRTAYPTVSPTAGAEYRLFSVAMILANKYLDDKTFTNKTWATLTAMSINEVNIMEREFLSILNFDLTVNEREFVGWINSIEAFLNERSVDYYIKTTPTSLLAAAQSNSITQQPQPS